MPTARELLEQADALMRRNRSPLVDDIPVLTDSVPARSTRTRCCGRAAQRATDGAGAHDPDSDARPTRGRAASPPRPRRRP